MDTLHVVTALANPRGYRARTRLWKEFAARMAATPGVQLHTTEVLYGGQEPVTTASDSALRLGPGPDIWVKENALNLAVQRLLPHNWKYVAWIDADVAFVRPDWVQASLAELQRHAVIQPWSRSHDVLPDSTLRGANTSFGACYQQKVNRYASTVIAPSDFWHPGYAWCCRREAFDRMGGLLDWSAAGSADHHMAHGFIGGIASTVPPTASPGFRTKLASWQRAAMAAAPTGVGVVEGALLHYWHGPKSKRHYGDRWEMLLRNQFDPITDVVYDSQGLIRLTPEKPHLAADLRHYFNARDEDSVEVDTTTAGNRIDPVTLAATGPEGTTR